MSNPEFRCFFCLNPADRVAYYSKAYGSMMGHTIENPTLCCESCYRSPRIINQINPMRGGDEGMFSFKFKAIGEWNNKQVAFYTSTRKWEINHLSTKPMRKHDNLIKRSLASVIPYIDTAKLERSEPKDGVVTISLTKTHAPKGAGKPGSSFSPVIASLIASEADGTNAVIKTFLHIEQSSKEIASYQRHQILELKKQIECAFKAGEKQDAAFKAVVSTLAETSPQAARAVPVGF